MVDYTNQPGYRGPQTKPNGKQPQGFPMGQTPATVPQAPAAKPTFQAPSGYSRVSPGMYRGPDGKLYQQSQIQGKMAEPIKPPPAGIKTLPRPISQTQPPPAATDTQVAQQALMGTYTLPTQEEMQGMFQKRYEQELADITTGVAERQAREQATREQMLYDRGISPDSGAYANELRGLQEARALEAAQARSQARQFAEGATAQEFSRRIQSVQAAQEQQKIAQANRQYEKTYQLERKRILSDIQNNKTLTKLERQKIKSAERQGDLERANRLAIAAMQRAGQGDEAQAFVDRIALARNERFQYLTRQPDASRGIAGLGLSPEEANKILEREERGGSRETTYRFR